MRAAIRLHALNAHHHEMFMMFSFLPFRFSGHNACCAEGLFLLLRQMRQLLLSLDTFLLRSGGVFTQYFH